MKMKKTASVILVLCLIFATAFCLTSCKEEPAERSKTADFSHAGIKYSFDIPEGHTCIVDNNDKQVVWMYKGDNPGDWSIIIEITPDSSKDDFELFDINQRSFVKSKTASTLADGVFFYDYDTDPDVATLYGIASYNEELKCIVYLKASRDVDVSVASSLFQNAVLIKADK